MWLTPEFRPNCRLLLERQLTAPATHTVGIVLHTAGGGCLGMWPNGCGRITKTRCQGTPEISAYAISSLSSQLSLSSLVSPKVATPVMQGASDVLDIDVTNAIHPWEKQ